MPNCIIGSLSTSSNSMVINGGSESWNLAALATAGGITVHRNPSLPSMFTQFPLQKPYGSVTKLPLTGSFPSGACTADPNYSSSTLLTLNPSFYCGLTFSGAAKVKLNAGLYYIDGVYCTGHGNDQTCTGNLSITGLTSGASISGTGVTIVLTNVNQSYAGGVDIEPGTCSATVSLTAPGPGAGLLKPSTTASQGC